MTENNSDAVPPSPKLTELAERLSGNWHVTGPDIDGEAEYKPVNGGLLLVGRVTVIVNGAEMTNLQHISHDRATDTLQARYMDTLGQEAVYTWVLDGQQLRVSQDGQSDTYFEARFTDDNSQYAGRWHYPEGVGDDAVEELIVYTRVS